MDKGTAMPSNVVQIDEERIKDHLGWIVRGTVEDTLNALLDTEADRLCMPSASGTEHLTFGMDHFGRVTSLCLHRRLTTGPQPTLPARSSFPCCCRRDMLAICVFCSLSA